MSEFRMPKYRSKKDKLKDDIVSRMIAAQDKVTRLEAAIGVAMDVLPEEPAQAHEVLRLALEEPPPWIG